MPDTIRWPIHDLPANEVYDALATSSAGLAPDEAARRLVSYGRNSLELKAGSLTGRFLRQFTHFLAFLLWIAAALAFLAEYLHPGEGMAVLGWAILGVIIVNAIFAFIQEYKAERAVQALRGLLPSHTWVLRAGKHLQIPRTDIVPGDLLLLEEGEQIPADARLVEAVGMRVDNSSLTGESQAQLRTAQPVEDNNLHDIANLVFAGTTVLSGHGQAAVFATGMQTEFGKIARLTTSVQSGLSPLQKEIIRITHVLGLFALAMGGMFLWSASGWDWASGSARFSASASSWPMYRKDFSRPSRWLLPWGANEWQTAER